MDSSRTHRPLSAIFDLPTDRETFVLRYGAIFIFGGLLIGFDRPGISARSDELPVEPLPAVAPPPTTADQPAPLNKRPTSRPIGAITTDIAPPAGELPEDVAAREAIFADANEARHFGETLFFWQASNLQHQPLRFEQAYVERYGYHYGLLQPVVSGVEFYGDVALLPAKVLAVGPRRSIYTLGTARPGSSGVPYRHR